MTNIKHVEQINKNKNVILNHLSTKSNLFRFNFLNSSERLHGVEKTFRRQDKAGCHFSFIPFTESNDNFNHYGDAHFYYISFNVWTEYIEQTLCVREDYLLYLIDFQKSNSIKDKSFLVISNINNKVYEVPFENALKYYIANKKEAVKQYAGNDKRTVYIPLTKENVSFEADTNYEVYHKPQNKRSFDPKYFKPEYIGNFRYSSYQSATHVTMYNVSITGEVIKQRTFRSIKECYDTLQKNGVVDFSYKTLQRKIAAEEVLLETKYGTIILSLKDDKESFELEEVIDETMPNPFYDETQPEDEFGNMKNIVVKSHVEIANKLSEDEITRIVENDIKEKEILHDIDIEDFSDYKNILINQGIVKEEEEQTTEKDYSLEHLAEIALTLQSQ